MIYRNRGGETGIFFSPFKLKTEKKKKEEKNRKKSFSYEKQQQQQQLLFFKMGAPTPSSLSFCLLSLLPTLFSSPIQIVGGGRRSSTTSWKEGGGGRRRRDRLQVACIRFRPQLEQLQQHNEVYFSSISTSSSTFTRSFHSPTYDFSSINFCFFLFLNFYIYSVTHFRFQTVSRFLFPNSSTSRGDAGDVPRKHIRFTPNQLEWVLVFYLPDLDGFSRAVSDYFR